MIKKQIVALFTAFCCATAPVIGQTQEKEQQDAQKEKGWSGLQMPNWVFSSIGVFIL